MIDFVQADWPSPARIRAVQTQRGGGVSRGIYQSLNLGDHVGDDPAAVAANRLRVQTDLRLPGAPTWLKQVHGTRVLRLPANSADLSADAVWTDQPGVACAVMTADCLPVLFCADDGSAVAAAHAGWRGLADGVLEATVAALPVPASRLLAWFGAAIGPDAFEVGPEVRAYYIDTDAEAAAYFQPGRGDRWHADIFGLARMRLQRLGLRSIHGRHVCTVSDAAAWFSHRRDGACGRMAALIWIDADTV